MSPKLERRAGQRGADAKTDQTRPESLERRVCVIPIISCKLFLSPKLF